MLASPSRVGKQKNRSRRVQVSAFPMFRSFFPLSPEYARSMLFFFEWLSLRAYMHVYNKHHLYYSSKYFYSPSLLNLNENNKHANS
jgi:hypothetical protein